MKVRTLAGGIFHGLAHSTWKLRHLFTTFVFYYFYIAGEGGVSNFIDLFFVVVQYIFLCSSVGKIKKLT